MTLDEKEHDEIFLLRYVLSHGSNMEKAGASSCLARFVALSLQVTAALRARLQLQQQLSPTRPGAHAASSPRLPTVGARPRARPGGGCSDERQDDAGVAREARAPVQGRRDGPAADAAQPRAHV